MDGNTLYPKKQFHSSPGWICLHLSGTIPPQYLTEQDRFSAGEILGLPHISSSHHLQLKYSLQQCCVVIGCLTWCLFWWSPWGNKWQCPHSLGSDTACCPRTSRNLTDLALVSLCALDLLEVLPLGLRSAGPRCHQRCTHTQTHTYWMKFPQQVQPTFTGMWMKCRLWNLNMNTPAPSQEQNLGVVQTFGQQVFHHLLNDQWAHKGIATYGWDQTQHCYLALDGDTLVF